MRFLLFLSFLMLALMVMLVVWPEVDLAASALFYNEGDGFFLSDNGFLDGLKRVAFYGARVLVVLFVLLVLLSVILKRLVGGVSGKGWLFLLACLLVGPGLLANVVLKDNWGRARPRDVQTFGGHAQFTPALAMADQCKRNCSFVSGDAAFGFFLPAFAFVVYPRRRKAFFWAGLGVGCLFAGARLLVGAHFLSDILFAMVLTLGTSTGLAVLFFGQKAMIESWKVWFEMPQNPYEKAMRGRGCVGK